MERQNRPKRGPTVGRILRSSGSAIESSAKEAIAQRLGLVRAFATICGTVYDVDKVAPENILDRRADVEIGRFTHYQRVRAILDERFRLATGCVPQAAVQAETAPAKTTGCVPQATVRLRLPSQDDGLRSASRGPG